MNRVSVDHNKDRGEHIEDTLQDIYGYEPNPNGEDYDLCTRDERPAEVKSCLDQLKSGRHGRFFISKEPHHHLIEHDGEYIFLVLDRESYEITRIAVLPAERVDDLIDSWWNAGRGAHTVEGDVTRLDTDAH